MPTRMILPADDPPLSVSCGGGHTLVLLSSGAVLSCGLNDWGQLGTGAAPGQEGAPLPSPVASLPPDVLFVSAGSSHSAAVTASGRVFAWGRNDKGQCGLGPRAPAAVPSPTEVPSLEGIVRVSAGATHTLAVSDSGALFAWGEHALLGLGAEERWRFPLSPGEPSPRLVRPLQGVRVVGASAGRRHSLAFDDAGALFAFGAPLLPRRRHLPPPAPLRSAQPLCSSQLPPQSAQTPAPSAAPAAAAAVSPGESSFHQTGTGSTAPQLSPAELPHPRWVLSAAAGGLHSLAAARGGGPNVFAWGANSHGALGRESGRRKAAEAGDPRVPGVVRVDPPAGAPEGAEGPPLQLLQVSAGWQHSAGVDADGALWTWGWGGSEGSHGADGESSGGQLGHGDEFDYWQPTRVAALAGAGAVGLRVAMARCPCVWSLFFFAHACEQQQRTGKKQPHGSCTPAAAGVVRVQPHGGGGGAHAQSRDSGACEVTPKPKKVLLLRRPAAWRRRVQGGVAGAAAAEAGSSRRTTSGARRRTCCWVGVFFVASPRRTPACHRRAAEGVTTQHDVGREGTTHSRRPGRRPKVRTRCATTGPSILTQQLSSASRRNFLVWWWRCRRPGAKGGVLPAEPGQEISSSIIVARRTVARLLAASSCCVRPRSRSTNSEAPQHAAAAQQQPATPRRVPCSPPPPVPPPDLLPSLLRLLSVCRAVLRHALKLSHAQHILYPAAALARRPLTVLLSAPAITTTPTGHRARRRLLHGARAAPAPPRPPRSVRGGHARNVRHLPGRAPPSVSGKPGDRRNRGLCAARRGGQGAWGRTSAMLVTRSVGVS